jgi:hypothetical protein
MPDPFRIERVALLAWADRVSAQSEFPRLVRRLILETGEDVVGLDFPAGEGVSVGDWDGSVRSGSDTPFIPAGLSVWELSVNKKSSQKADADYAKRTATPDGTPTSEATYVAAILRPWTKQAEWAKEKASDGRWGSVRTIGVDKIEAWLESAPVTSAWLAELLGLAPFGMRAVDAWWRQWAGSTSPAMPPGLLLAGREKVAEALRERLAGSVGVTTISAASVEEVEAFIASFAVSLVADAGGTLARFAFVDQVATWRALEGTEHPLVLVPRGEEVRKEAAGGSRHHVLVPLPSSADVDHELPPIDPEDAREALTEAGISDEGRSRELAYLARRTVLALRRSLAVAPGLHSPHWAQPPADRMTRAALLAGRWNEGVPGDSAVVSELAALTGEDLREALEKLAAAEDPLVVRLGRSWALTSSYDAWLQLAGRLRDQDLARLEKAVRSVLLETDPALTLPPGERWKAGLEGKTSAYSRALRDGLADSILLLAINGEKAVEGRGGDCASYLVHLLGEEANKDETGALWSSLAPQLPQLAEAAPDAFLEAVRAGLVGEAPVIAALFADPKSESALFTAGSPHTHLLWALETVAWSEEHFGAAVVVLARLAEIDPGGSLSNRPTTSLARIFCPWYPDNSVDNARRIAVIDTLRERHPTVAWGLMLSMLPESHAIHMPAAEPTYRNWVPPRREVGGAEYFELVGAIAERLAEDAGAEAPRWAKLIEKGANLPPGAREMIRKGIVARGDDFDAAERADLWEELRAFVARHREYAHADWALPASEIEEYEALLGKLSPSTAAERLRFLFEEYHPGLTGAGLENLGDFETGLQERRAAAATEIEAEGGLEALLELARASKQPGTVGRAIAAGSQGRHDVAMMKLLASEEATDRTIAGTYFEKRLLQDGWEVLSKEPREPVLTARILLCSPEREEAWGIASSRGAEVERAYWSEFAPYGLGGDFAQLGFAATKLLGVGRPAAALRLIGLYLRKDLDAAELVPLVADALDALLAPVAEDEDEARLEGFDAYDFGQLFEFLEEHREVLGIQRLGRLEWAYLGALGLDPSAPTLYEALAEDPAFFVGVVSAIYKPHSAEAAEPDEAARRAAENGFHLLSAWDRVPGEADDGAIEEEALRTWAEKAREILAAADRLQVGEGQIGAILAYAHPDGDGTWPPEPVRNVLEYLDSRAVERGMATAKYNSRGVVSKSIDAGGEAEHELAEGFERQAKAFRDRWPRSAAVLGELAVSYRRDARRGDEEAEQRRQGFDR